MNKTIEVAYLEFIFRMHMNIQKEYFEHQKIQEEEEQSIIKPQRIKQHKKIGIKYKQSRDQFLQKYDLAQYEKTNLADNLSLISSIIKQSSLKQQTQQTIISSLLKHKIQISKKFVYQPLIQKISQTTNATIMKFQVRLNVFVFQILVYNADNDENISKFEEQNIFYLKKGGFSNVYSFQDQYAIKKISFDSSNNSEVIIPAIIEYCYCKLASALKIGLQTITPFGFDLICTNCQIFFSMQLGQKNTRIFKQNNQTELAEAIFILHKLHICHFDIKESNIQYSPMLKKFVFFDFGLSQTLQQVLGEQTKIIHFKGTYSFCCKEMKDVYCKKYSQMQYNYVDLYYNDIHCLQEALKYLYPVKKDANKIIDSLQFQSCEINQIIDKQATFWKTIEQTSKNAYKQLRCIFYLHTKDFTNLQIYLKDLTTSQRQEVSKIFSQLEVNQTNKTIYYKFFRTSSIQSQISSIFQWKNLQNERTYYNSQLYERNNHKYQFNQYSTMFQIISPEKRFKMYLISWQKYKNKFSKTQNKLILYQDFIKYINWSTSFFLQDNFHNIIYKFFYHLVQNQKDINASQYEYIYQYLNVQYQKLPQIIKKLTQKLIIICLAYIVRQLQIKMKLTCQKIKSQLQKSKILLKEINFLFQQQNLQYMTMSYCLKTFQVIQNPVDQQMLVGKHMKSVLQILTKAGFYEQKQFEIVGATKWNVTGRKWLECLHNYCIYITQNLYVQTYARQSTEEALNIYIKLVFDRLYYDSQNKTLINATFPFKPLCQKQILILKEFYNVSQNQFKCGYNIPIEQVPKIIKILSVIHIYLKKCILFVQNYTFGGVKSLVLNLLLQVKQIDTLLQMHRTAGDILFEYCKQLLKKQICVKAIKMIQKLLHMFLVNKNKLNYSLQQTDLLYTVLIQYFQRFQCKKNKQLQNFMRRRLFNQSSGNMKNQIFKIVNQKQQNNNSIYNCSSFVLQGSAILIQQNKLKQLKLIQTFNQIQKSDKFSSYTKYQSISKIVTELNQLKINIIPYLKVMIQLLDTYKAQLYKYLFPQNLNQNTSKVFSYTNSSTLKQMDTQIQLYTNMIRFISNQNSQQYCDFVKNQVQKFINNLSRQLSESQFKGQQINVRFENFQILAQYNSVMEIKRFLYYHAHFSLSVITYNYIIEISKNRNDEQRQKQLVTMIMKQFPYSYSQMHQMLIIKTNFNNLSKQNQSNFSRQQHFNNILVILKEMSQNKCHWLFKEQFCQNIMLKMLPVLIQAEFRKQNNQIQIQQNYIFQLFANLEKLVIQYQSKSTTQKYVQIIYYLTKTQMFKVYATQILLSLHKFSIKYANKPPLLIKTQNQKPPCTNKQNQIINSEYDQILECLRDQSLQTSRQITIFKYLVVTSNLQKSLQLYSIDFVTSIFVSISKKIQQSAGSCLKENILKHYYSKVYKFIQFKEKAVFTDYLIDKKNSIKIYGRKLNVTLLKHYRQKNSQRQHGKTYNKIKKKLQINEKTCCLYVSKIVEKLLNIKQNFKQNI